MDAFGLAARLLGLGLAVSAEEILMSFEAVVISVQNDRVLPKLPFSAVCLICVCLGKPTMRSRAAGYHLEIGIK